MCWRPKYEHKYTVTQKQGDDLNVLSSKRHYLHGAQWRTKGGGFGVFKTPPPRNSEDIVEVLEHMSKKNRRLDFLL